MKAQNKMFIDKGCTTLSTISVISRGMLNVAFTQIEYYITNQKSTVAASRIVHMFICPFNMSSS